MRRLLYPGLDDKEAAALKLTDFVGQSKPKAKPRKPRESSKKIDIARQDIRDMIATKNFSGMGATHLVALYEQCHADVYGVTPAELVPDWKIVMQAIERLVTNEFKGDYESVVDFIRWTWQREQWRQKNRPESAQVFRVGWRLQFVYLGMVTDYRTFLVRGQ
jgi:hypothetical protein